MDVEPFVRRIRDAFPEFSIRDVAVPTQGMDHVALVVNGQWIFRFPNRTEYFKTFGNEVRLLERLSGVLPLPIPRYAMLPEDRSFGGYAMVPGVEFTDDVFARLSEAERDRVATEIASFLTALHGYPAGGEIPLPTADQAKFLAELRKNYDEVVAGRVAGDDRAACEGVFRNLEDMLAEPTPVCLIHEDFTWWHILIDDRKHLGVIDFGDACFGDPAVDFGPLWIYGGPFVETVYERYCGPKDDGLLRRSLLFFKRLGIDEMALALKGEIGTVENAETVFRKALGAGRGA